MQDKYQERMCMVAANVSDTLLNFVFSICKGHGREMWKDYLSLNGLCRERTDAAGKRVRGEGSREVKQQPKDAVMEQKELRTHKEANVPACERALWALHPAVHEAQHECNITGKNVV